MVNGSPPGAPDDAPELAASLVERLAYETPGSIGSPLDWLRVFSPPRYAETDRWPGLVQRFERRLASCFLERLQGWSNLLYDALQKSDAAGAGHLVSLLFLTELPRCALLSKPHASGAMAEWANARLGLLGDSASLASDAFLDKAREHLAQSYAGAPYGSSFGAQLKGQALQAGARGVGAWGWALKSGERVDSAYQACCRARALDLETFEAYLPLARQMRPAFLSSGEALAVSGGDPGAEFPEAFLSASVARKALRGWVGEGFADPANSARLIDWMCSTEGALPDLMDKIPDGALWPNRLRGRARITLPNRATLSLFIKDTDPDLSIVDCALFAGRPLPLKALSARFGPPNVDRLRKALGAAIKNAELTHLTPATIQALMTRLAEVEAREIESGLRAPAAASGAPQRFGRL